jgi:hypothetical protein
LGCFWAVFGLFYRRFGVKRARGRVFLLVFGGKRAVLDGFWGVRYIGNFTKKASF